MGNVKTAQRRRRRSHRKPKDLLFRGSNASGRRKHRRAMARQGS